MCGGNDDHTTSFHSEWSNNTGTLCLTATHGYWCKSGKMLDGQQGINNNGGRISGSGSGTNQVIHMLGHMRSTMSELTNSQKDTAQ